MPVHILKTSYKYDNSWPCNAGATSKNRSPLTLKRIVLNKIHNILVQKYLEKKYELHCLHREFDNTSEFLYLQKNLPTTLSDLIQRQYYACQRHSQYALKTVFYVGRKHSHFRNLSAFFRHYQRHFCDETCCQ